jgi:long-chain acyl-CoA synthetase
MLPPAHLFELQAGLLAPLQSGACVVYAGVPLPNRLVESLRSNDITHAISVPALVHALYEELLGELADLGLIDRAARHQSPAETPSWFRRHAGDAASERVVAGVRERIGATLRTLVVGGAALDPAWGELLRAIGITLEVGYGLTEAGPIVSVGRSGDCPPDSVGRPLPGIDVRLDERGEILVRGPRVMRGYFEDARATAQALDAGWLRTGDLGRIDDLGFLYVTGRVKEAIVTEAGETLYPEEIEPYYESPLYAEHCVVPMRGARGNDVPALVVVPAMASTTTAELERELARLRAAAPSRLRVASLVRLDSPLPRTALGKLRRRALAESLATRAREEDA